MRDRAVSEVLGFILVASLIFATLGVVYVAGLGGLEDTRDAERLQNAERAFEVLADNMADVYAEGAPNRATEIKLADAQLEFGSSTTLSVEITNAASGSPSYSTDLDPIVYSAGTGTKIVYEAGAVFRVEPDGAVLKRKPRFVFHEDANNVKTAAIPYVQTRPGFRSGTSIGGSTTVLVRASSVQTDILANETQPTDPFTTEATSDAGDADAAHEFAVTFTIQTSENRADAWKRFLNDRIPGSFDANAAPVCGVSGGTVTCEIAVERLFVTASRIDVTFA